jgi:hypothetical protein
MCPSPTAEYSKECNMYGTFGGRLAAGIIALTLAASACDYDGTGSNPVYGDGSTGGFKVNAKVFTASGDLTAVLAEFRATLGDPANRDPGEVATGRREVSWDGVAGDVLNVNTFPGDFFNRVVPRGQIYTTAGTGFRVGDDALAVLNPEYAAQFAAFSPAKIFIPVGSRDMTVNFVVAGSETPAQVTGFGVVFSDVDRAQSATLSFFDTRGRLLRRAVAPVRSDAAGFSFVGVTFPTAIVARVEIRSGEAAITGANSDISAGGTADLVVMDDFISGEPHAAQ